MTTARDAVGGQETQGAEPNSKERAASHAPAAAKGDAGAVESSDGSAKRPNFNIVSAVFFVLFGILLYLITPYQVEEPVIIFGQSLNALDPTLFPRILAVGFVLLGGWYAVVSLGLRERNGFRDLDRQACINVGVSIGAFALYAVAMEPLGFVLSSVLLILGLSAFYGARNLFLIALVGIGVPITIYMIFTRLLQVFLPEFPDV